MIDFDDFKQLYQNVEIEHYPNSIPEKVLVSVLVQTYNHEPFLQQCLDSILSQKTDFNFEIILGEDNSKDKTREICIEYAEKHPHKIRLFLHSIENKISVNGIQTGNFNALYNLFNAKGDYIAFCEGDDYWKDPKKLQKQFDFMEKNDDCSCCYHNFEEYFDDVKLQSRQEGPRMEIDQQDLQKVKFHPLLSTTFFRMPRKEVPEEMIRVINMDTFLLSLLGQHGKAAYIDCIKPTIYKRHSGGIWSSNNRKKQLQIKVNTFFQLYHYYSRINYAEVAKHFKNQTLNYKKMLIRNSFLQGNLKAVTKYIRSYLSLRY